MKKWYLLILLIWPKFILCQSKFYSANFGLATFYRTNAKIDRYDMITTFKIGFGRQYVKNKYGFTYNLYFCSNGAYDKDVDTIARLPYIGLNSSFIYKLNNISVNTGLYFAYCLNRKSPSIYPEAYYYYKKSDFGISIQPEYKILSIRDHQILVISEIYGSLLPIYTTDVGSRPILINKTTRNLSFAIGIKYILGKCN